MSEPLRTCDPAAAWVGYIRHCSDPASSQSSLLDAVTTWAVAETRDPTHYSFNKAYG